MNEKVELVTTRIYTSADLLALFGEGKKDFKLFVGIRSRSDVPTHWNPVSILDQEVIKIEIREPYAKKNT